MCTLRPLSAKICFLLHQPTQMTFLRLQSSGRRAKRAFPRVMIICYAMLYACTLQNNKKHKKDLPVNIAYQSKVLVSIIWTVLWRSKDTIRLSRLTIVPMALRLRRHMITYTQSKKCSDVPFYQLKIFDRFPIKINQYVVSYFIQCNLKSNLSFICDRKSKYNRTFLVQNWPGSKKDIPNSN